MKKIAVIVPHGDDEVLGFAGAIQHHIACGDHVTVIFVRGSLPDDSRTMIQLEHTKVAMKILGYHEAEYLHIPESTISDNPHVLFKSLEALLLKIQPTIVYTMFWGDNHQDHRITYDCVSRLVRVWGGLSVQEFYVGETISSTDQAVKVPHNMFVPNYYIKMSSAGFNKKVAALRCYTQEIMPPPHPRSETGLETLARYRGMECNSEFAEAYIALRVIV